MRDLNRIKVVLVEKNQMVKWLAEELETLLDIDQKEIITEKKLRL